MSLILEALKKSEQQRRLGEVPTLGSPVLAMRRRRRVLPLIVIVFLAAAGATTWWLMRKRASAPPAASSPITAAAPTAAQKLAQMPAAPATPAPSKPARPAPPPRAHSPTQPGALRPGHGTVLDDLGAKERQARVEQIKAEEQAAAGRKPPAQGATRSAPASAGTMKPAGAAATEAAAVARETTAPSKTAAAPASKAGAKPADTIASRSVAPSAAKSRPEPLLPMIWDLPYSVRKDLPAIEMTMHVYAANPEDRFVVIKGERHVEGDELADDLILREIRRDGLVLEYKGKKFLYPRNGR